MAGRQDSDYVPLKLLDNNAKDWEKNNMNLYDIRTFTP
jgi:hypothetical protein